MCVNSKGPTSTRFISNLPACAYIPVTLNLTSAYYSGFTVGIDIGFIRRITIAWWITISIPISCKGEIDSHKQSK
jgi:hypothetical protein